jgi:hypothetical protein
MAAAAAAGFSAGAAHTPTGRGRQVQLVFTMQGMGIFRNSRVMTILLYVTGQTGRDNGYNNATADNYSDYDPATLLFIWRFTYVLGEALLLAVLASRYLYLEESTVWLDDKRRREQLARKGDTAANVATTNANARGATTSPQQQQQQALLVIQ